MKSAPPRGTIRSMYRSIPSIDSTSFLSGSSTNCTPSRGTSAASRASQISAASTRLELIASLPPRRSVALPDFRHRAAMSTVTLGLLSYMAPMTPRGTRFFPTISPLGRVCISNTSPTGSGIAATVRTSRAIPSSRSGESRSRSSRAPVRPLAIPTSMSLRLASRTRSCCSRSATAIRSSAPSFRPEGRRASARAAFRATSPWAWSLSTVVVTICPIFYQRKLLLSPFP